MFGGGMVVYLSLTSLGKYYSTNVQAGSSCIPTWAPVQAATAHHLLCRDGIWEDPEALSPPTHPMPKKQPLEVSVSPLVLGIMRVHISSIVSFPSL